MGFRYIGSKSNILPGVLKKISELTQKGEHITDLMCGTATVSLALRKLGYKVTAVDVMTYSYHHATVALLLNRPPEFIDADDFINSFFFEKNPSLFPLSKYEKILVALSNVSAKKGYFWREFSVEGAPKNTTKPRNYFSPENAKKIDGIRFWIKKLRRKESITDIEHSLLLHDLIMAANDVANISGTYGHYLSKLLGRAKGPLKIKPTVIEKIPDKFSHTVLKGYAEELAGQIKCDLCYIDPPYMKRQYAANYHILETLAREDNPEAVGVSGLRPWRDQYSNFCTKTKIQDSFKRIFTKMGCSKFLISYSQDGLLALDNLLDLFSNFGKTSVDIIKNKRFRSNQSPLASNLDEYLIYLRV